MLKYHNKKTFYGGVLYDSKKEAGRAFELDMLHRGKVILSWERQPLFSFEHNGVKICKYVGDFKVTYPDGRVEIEDVKGVKTAVYRLKKKLLRAFHGIEIKEV